MAAALARGTSLIEIAAKEPEFAELCDFLTLMGAIVKARPAAVKGQYLKSVTVASTMGPGEKVNPALIQFLSFLRTE